MYAAIWQIDADSTGGDSELGAVARLGSQNWGRAALLKAVWWNLHLASLLMHLFLQFIVRKQNVPG